MNIGEIARAAGVSRSTVSYALSGKRRISRETRDRIQAVIKDLGYRPNASARALANGRTSTLALVFPPSPAPGHYTDMQLGFIGSVVEAAAERGYDVLVSAGSPAGADGLARLAGERRVDGVLLMESLLDDPRAHVLRGAGIPYVAVGRGADATAAGQDWVDLDHGALVATCVHHLAGLGHRHIALVNRPEELLNAGYANAHRGAESFTAAAAAHGLSARLHPCDDTVAAGEECARRILREDPRTTAVVTLNEASLAGLFRGLAAEGLGIPDDISVAGVAADRWATACTPELSACDVPAAAMGRQAVHLLLRRVAEPAAAVRQVLFTSTLTVRSSTGPAPHRAVRSGPHGGPAASFAEPVARRGPCPPPPTASDGNPTK